MDPHTVRLDHRHSPTQIEFAPTFNVSVTFVDRHLAAGHGDQIMARWTDRTLTYSALYDRVTRMAGALRSLGLMAGDRVLLLVKDEPTFYTAFLGAVRIGAIAVPVNYFLRAQDYAYMLADSQAKVVVAASDTRNEVEPALRDGEIAVTHRIVADGPDDGDWLSLDELLAAAGGNSDAAATTPVSECFWLYSSGSTGAPKAAVHQHKDMVYTSQYFGVDVLGLSQRDVIFSPPKLFFAYGIGNSLSFPLWTGARALLLEARPTAENTLQTISDLRPSVYFGVPTLYAAQLAALEDGHAADLSSLRLCVSGGEPLPPALLDGWRRVTGLEILDGIGSSEVLHLYTCNRPGQTRPGSAGPIVPGYTARIVDDEANDIVDGEVGELVIRGDSCARYYWNKPDRSAQSMRGEWFYTGDKCYRDEEGYYYFCGRGDDMLKVGGIWVAPFEVESALVAYPAVLEAAVIGWPDASGLIKPKAFVVLRDGATADARLAAQIRAFVKDRLAPFKYPRWIEFIEELPKTASGKIQRFRLRDTARGTTGAP